MADELPSVPVPLSAGDADATRNLNAAFRDAYGPFRFDDILADREALPGPVTAEERAWVAERLRAAGRA